MDQFVHGVLPWICLTLGLGAVVHLGIVLSIPWLAGAYLRSLEPPNAIFHAPKISAAYNPIRRSGTDLIYSVCNYNLSRGPLRVAAPVVKPYTSFSCFALNSDNFFIKNDQQVKDGFDVVLIGPRAPEPAAPESEIVRSPTTTGFLIFRYFVGDGSHEEQIERMRREIRLVRFGES